MFSRQFDRPMKRNGSRIAGTMRRLGILELLEHRRLLAGTTADAITLDAKELDIVEGEPATISGRFDPVTTAPIQVEVDWGDFSDNSFVVPSGSSEFSFSHDYDGDQRLGVVVVQFASSITFADNGDSILTVDVPVSVKNAPPVITNTDVPIGAVEGQEITVSATAVDPGDDPILYTWNFGDGSGLIGGSTVSHVYPDDGEYTIKLTVTDDDLGFVRYTQGISIGNASPEANTDSKEIFARAVTPVVGNVLDNDTDAAGDADPLLVTAFATENNPDKDVAGSYGILKWEADGHFSYLPDTSNPAVALLNEGESLTDEFVYAISDGDDGTDIASLNINIVGSILPLVVVDTDTTPDGVAEDAVPGTGVGITATTNAVAGVTTTFELTDSAAGRFQIHPSAGIVTVANSELLDFEASPLHQITVAATTNAGESETKDFLIQIGNVNEVPLTQIDTGFSIDEDGVLTVPGLPDSGLLSNDLDPDGDPLSVVAVESPTALGATVTFSSDGGFQYDPKSAPSLQALASGNAVLDTFSYTVSDPSGLRATAKAFVNVAGVEDDPTAGNDVLTVFEGSGPIALTSSLLINDSDADAGDMVSIVSIDATRTVGSVTFDSGEVVYDPAGKFDELNDGQTAEDTFSYTVKDQHGRTASAQATVVVFGIGLPENIPPTISEVTNQTIDEGGSTGPLSFTVNDLETLPDDLFVTATSLNPALVPDANITLGGSGANRSVTVVPVADGFGSATIKLDVTDGLVLSSELFTVTVNPINDQPTISDISDQTIDEDGTTGLLSFTVGDSDSAADDLVVVTTSSNSALVPDGNITVGGSGVDRTVSMVPVADQSGSATITVTVSDGELSASDTFVVTVRPMNDSPTISDVADQTIFEDGTIGPLNFTLGDVETPAADLTVTATSSNPALVPDANIILEGSGANRVVTAVAAADQFGTSTITLTVSDGVLSSTETFVVTVNVTNDPPTITDVTNQTIEEDGTTGALRFSISDVETAATDLTVTAVSFDTTLVPNDNVTLSGSGANRTVTVAPVGDLFGVATISLTVSDGELSVSDTFVVTVLPVNDRPTISNIADQAIDSDGTTGPLGFTVGDRDTVQSRLTVTASSSNPALIPDANITLDATNGQHTVTAVPMAGLSGFATITVTVSDGELTANDTFTVTVGQAPEPPRVTAVERNDGRIRFDQLQSLAFTFSSDVSASLDANDLVLINSITNEPIDLSSATVEWIAETKTARWDISSIDFAKARYSVQLSALGIQDTFGSPLDGNGDGTPGDDHRNELVVTWQGDTDVDLDVDFTDFTNVANGFGNPGGWEDGDFNDDQFVGFTDFVHVANNFGFRLEPAPGPAASEPALAADDVDVAMQTADDLFLMD